jgi:hypothetical protein
MRKLAGSRYTRKVLVQEGLAAGVEADAVMPE